MEQGMIIFRPIKDGKGVIPTPSCHLTRGKGIMKPEKRIHPRICVAVAFVIFLLTAMNVNGQIVPTIEKITAGRVKAGDLITKANVDAVKQWLAPSTYEQVKRGMILFMVPTTPMETTVPAYFMEATKRNAGQALLRANNVVYHKGGKKWPGGFPFPDPKTGEEAMANVKAGFSYGADDFTYHVRMDWVNKAGRSYKHSLVWYRRIVTGTRVKVPPIPAYPGYEEEAFRSIILFVEPDYVKGIRQVFIRYYDEAARFDEGYIYLPALKRTRPLSPISWQESMGGSDLTWGDVEGFLEPSAFWMFKLVNKTYMIMPGKDNPAPKRTADGGLIPSIQLDAGAKFTRMQWEVRPVVIVEAKPRGSHIYGKQIFYLDGLNWRNALAEKYDRQGKIWKAWAAGGGILRGKDGNNYGITYYPQQYDLQLDHMTRFTADMVEINAGQNINDYSVKGMPEIER